MNGLTPKRSCGSAMCACTGKCYDWDNKRDLLNRDVYNIPSFNLSHKIIGKCSLCGGNVTVPQVWHGIYQPEPTCDSCGAVKADDRPTIPMVKK